MKRLDYAGKPLDVNDAGFLANPRLWDDDVARFLAREMEGVETVGPEHWAVIRFVRGFWEQHGLAPLIRVMCKSTGLTLKRIYELFPSGPALGACKVAGLPSPDGCI